MNRISMCKFTILAESARPSEGQLGPKNQLHEDWVIFPFYDELCIETCPFKTKTCSYLKTNVLD